MWKCKDNIWITGEFRVLKHSNQQPYVCVAASSTALQAVVDGSAGVTITVISISTHAPVATHSAGATIKEEKQILMKWWFCFKSVMDHWMVSGTVFVFSATAQLVIHSLLCSGRSIHLRGANHLNSRAAEMMELQEGHAVTEVCRRRRSCRVIPKFWGYECCHGDTRYQWEYPLSFRLNSDQ